MSFPAVSPTAELGKRARTGFNPNIHGARGLFSFLVFVFHVAYSQLPPPPLPYYDHLQIAANSLAFGVELFFIISGIVILGAFRRAPSIRAFLVDRVTRIAPVLWAAVTVMFLLTLAGADTFTGLSNYETLAVFAGNLLALPPIIHIPLIHGAAWSLSYEFAFYLLFAIFGILAGLVGKRASGVLTFLLAIAVYWFHVRASFFVAGLVIGAGWMSHPRLQPILRFPFFWMLLFFVSWQTVATLVGGNIHSAVFKRLASEPLLLALALVAFFSALFAMSGIEQGRGQISALLRTRVMQWLGTVSFSLYLWQTPVMAVVKRIMGELGLVDLAGQFSQPLFFLIALPPTLIVSALSQRYLEVGVTNWLRARRAIGPATHLRTSKQA